MVISKAGKTWIVESNAKVNAKHYCNVLSKNIISEINLFIQCSARAHTAKLTLDMLKDKKQEPLITGAPSLATE